MEKQKKINNIFTEIKNYFISLFFLKQLIILAVLGILGLIFTIYGLKFYTHHGEAISVPDFSGMNLKSAKTLANKNDLTLIIVDSVYLSPGKRGSIVEQNPPKKFKVKEGRKIFLTIKAFLPEKTVMPDLHDISLQQAKAELENYGLKIGTLSYTSGYENVVKEQYFKHAIIETGKKIEKHKRIDLLLGKGHYPYTTIILLNELNVDECYNKLTSVYLNVGNIYYDQTVKTAQDSAKAQVWKQKPNILYTQRLNYGDKVNIWLTMDKFKVLTNKITEPKESEQSDAQLIDQINNN